MSKPNVGYLLPEGEAFTDDLECFLVFVPDKDEYRRAFFGAYFYFSNWLAWERDADKRGKDAARAWKLAVESTLECIEMAACDTIVALLQQIRDNTGVYCCDVLDITDGDQYTDEVEDGVGDVPQNIVDAGYADDAADWDGFDDYKCMISHVMIDNMAAQVGKIMTIIDESGAALVTVAVLAAIAAAVLTAGGSLLFAGVLLGVASAAGLYAAFTEVGEVGLPDLIDAVDEHHDALACAIYQADGSAAAVVALKDKIDELFNVAQAVFLKSLNIPSQLKALYGGRYDQQDIAQAMVDNGYDPDDYDCSCVVPASPVDLLIEAFAWDITCDGEALDGLGVTDHTRLRVENSTASSIYIPHNGQYAAATLPSNPFTWVCYEENTPAGYDSIGDVFNEWTDAEWRQAGNDMQWWLYHLSSPFSRVTVSNPRVFCDAGSGYQWYPARMTYVTRTTIRWQYTEGDGPAANIEWFDAQFRNGDAIIVRLLAMVPD